MLESTRAGGSTRPMMLVQHDDAVHEWVHGPDSPIGMFARRSQYYQPLARVPGIKHGCSSRTAGATTRAARYRCSPGSGRGCIATLNGGPHEARRDMAVRETDQFTSDFRALPTTNCIILLDSLGPRHIYESVCCLLSDEFSLPTSMEGTTGG